MKVTLIVLFTMMMSFAANAALVSCEYQAASCNEKGDKYLCTYYGWAHGEFCSAKDVSRRPGQRPKPEPDPEFVCADCYGQPKTSDQCRTQCGCSSAFCGSW